MRRLDDRPYEFPTYLSVEAAGYWQFPNHFPVLFIESIVRVKIDTLGSIAWLSIGSRAFDNPRSGKSPAAKSPIQKIRAEGK